MAGLINNEVGTIKNILVKPVTAGFRNQEKVNTEWKDLNYLSAPDYTEAEKEYNEFLNILRDNIEHVIELDENEETTIDSIYVRDTATMTPAGAVVCRMGKEKRVSERTYMKSALQDAGVKILGSIQGNGRLEGGDIIMVDEKTLAVGVGYRTNMNGIEQLKELTDGVLDEIFVAQLPHWTGPDDVFHLMSFVSPLSNKHAAVYSRLMPVVFREWLLDKGLNLIEVPDEEFETLGCNILALSPEKALMVKGNPVTKSRLEKAGIEVLEFKGDEICIKGGGGPTCLTRPVLRD